MKLLADSELVDFSQSEPGDPLRNGDEFLDLDQLAQGVQRARTGVVPAGQVLARKAIHEDTWRRILRQLSAARV
jgi:hypothetical protein